MNASVAIGLAGVPGEADAAVIRDRTPAVGQHGDARFPVRRIRPRFRGPSPREQGTVSTRGGQPEFASPHAQPIGLLPDGSRVYVANTAADTVDVLNRASGRLLARIDVGIDPVGIAVRPDGREVWVANHLSDSVSVIDSDPASETFDQVIATVQDLDPTTRATRFDEPVGVAFASDTKAYVALSSENLIAIVDVPSRLVVGHLEITAQDPRAISVRGDRLYVVPFESGNQTQLSGCLGAESIDGDRCTFDFVEQVVANNNVLSLGYDADIVREPRMPDRDLFVFDTATDQLVETVSTIGTLLYGVTADSNGRVFFAQTEARNDANGRAGTLKQTLVDLENRAFLNQIAVVDCSAGTCAGPRVIELEPLPPENPPPGTALATFGIQISGDDSTLVVTAAGSHRLFTLDASSGRVLGRVDVGWVPRGVVLESAADGSPQRAWVLNAVANSVSVVDVSSASSPRLVRTIELEDPTHPAVKLGRFAFANANASSTGTFSCESCHPDGNTDQLLWVLGGPKCELPGCDQIPPRSTMPIRGLRDTAPYHWDGVPGDPFGGVNGQFPDRIVPPNCNSPESCTRHLLDGALAGSICDQTSCPLNEEGKPGRLTKEERDAMAVFLLAVPYPPARERPIDDRISGLARQGFDDFFVNGDRNTCGTTVCHAMPFWTGTNTVQTSSRAAGMEAPTFRGLPDRWLILPQGRTNIFELLKLSADVNANLVPFDAEKGFDELSMFALTFGTEELPSSSRFGGFGPMAVWQMFLEGSTGFPGAFARQVTLNRESASLGRLAITESLLAALETAAADGAIVLRGEGARLGGGRAAPVALEFRDGAYRARDGRSAHPRRELLTQAATGELVLTLTGRLGPNVDVDHPQPELWSPPDPLRGPKHRFPRLPRENPMRLNGRHVADRSSVVVDGRRVPGRVSCAAGGSLPSCDGEEILVSLDRVPEDAGMHLLQVQTPGGLQSNEFIFFVDE